MSALAGIERAQVEGHEGYKLSAASGEWTATFLTSLGMVGCSLRHRGEELLAQRGGVSAYAERGSTFGIPLLHPWANRLGGWDYEAMGRRVTLDPQSPRVRRDSDTDLPIHGLLAASRFWTVHDTGVEGSAALLRAELDFAAHADLLAAFPFPHRLELEVRLDGDGLAITSTLSPTGDVDVPLCFGFHPYLQLPAGGRDAAALTLPVRRRLVLDERGLPTGETEVIASGSLDGPIGDRSFDDCYDDLEAHPRFCVVAGGRETTVSFLEGFVVAQVFCPPGGDFICFEPMVAPVNALLTGQGLRPAAPGRDFRASFAISSRARGS